jgi:polynucleotide 5'-kinase involved in rRNA processing
MGTEFMKRILVFLCFSVLMCLTVVPKAQAADATSSSTIGPKIEYTLPYPGILADNPLYIVKNLRDTIMELLIADPVKKIEFYILQSDKDVNAGIFLAAKAKGILALDAVVRADKTSGKAIALTDSLKTKGREIPAYVIERLQKSLAKHEEVVHDLTGSAAGAEKAGYEHEIEIIRGFAANTAKPK